MWISKLKVDGKVMTKQQQTKATLSISQFAYWKNI
jgi:hypothetical protein